MLARLLGPDLTVKEAVRALCDLEPVRHGFRLYEATAPAALCVAAVLARRTQQRPGAAGMVYAQLLGWLASVARDFDTACTEAGQRYYDKDFLEGCPVIAAVHALKPLLCPVPRRSRCRRRRDGAVRRPGVR
ncbi:hypothetical protein [Kitasatospora sp. NPDC001175]|uniref:hypothetical protein n=1 Tax=Kitasatospora sp. NPDC001175 TaxID=3157103 RepID=UPI003D006168